MDRDAPYRPPSSPIRPRPIRRSDAVGNQGNGWTANPLWVMALVATIGAVVSAAVSVTTWRIDRNTEHRLLQAETRQAANVLSSAIVGIVNPLQTAVDIATATDGDPARFTQYIAPYARSGATFDSVSLWKIGDGSPTLIASSGDAVATSEVSAAALTRAGRSTSFAVASLSSGSQLHIGYALASKPTSASPRYAVYGERPIPANRRVQIESTSAFADLHFATYLGANTDIANLQTTDQPPNRLPLRGDTDRQTIPFGDTELTLVASPIGHLGGSLGYELPWILLVAGALLTALITVFAGQLVRRRRDAERDAHTITGLYDRLDGLFAEQRTISETLQHALLPQVNPAIPALEIGSRYLAGVRGVDIGGDWYSIIALDATHFGFVVGDVSGRGVEAAALMARIRFTLRAYLFEGHSPAEALGLCARQIDIDTDLHFATVLVGRGDLSTRTITFANAGHLDPLLLTDGVPGYIDTTVGPPLGVLTSVSYPSTTVSVPPGSTLIAFTDGLIERRDEDLDEGRARLGAAASAAIAPTRAVEEVLTEVLARMTGDGTEDDVAILAFRWS